MNFSKFVSFVCLYNTIHNTYISFAMEVAKSQKSCLQEWFPSQESIAVNYRLLVPDQSEGKDFQVLQDPNSAQYQMLDLEFYNQNRTMIGQVKNSKETWTHVTQDAEVLEFCVNNRAQVPLIIEYNITMNVYNNDHTRVADKTHLTQYEQDIIELEKLTKEIKEDNVVVKKRSKNRKLKSAEMNSLVSKIAGLAIIFIVLVKLLEIWFLRKKLRDKKMLQVNFKLYYNTNKTI